MPTGLSSTTQPCTSRLSRLNCFGRSTRGGAVAMVVGASALRTSSVIAVLFEIAFDLRRAQQLFDALGFGETIVHPESEIGREFQIDAVGDFATQEFLVALEQ